ncbi:MAG: hypothetical protein FWH44_05720, partial [Methanomassiliicoccaceae archaeon]|nr:hypothetical protein [Methanomassiliicoccaceae archaeon]
MISMKIIAIIAAVAVTTAGVAAVLYIMMQDDPAPNYDDRGRLMIFGNANGDDYLDDNDITYLEAIIGGDVAPTPLADANQDGAVDEKDIDFVRKMIENSQKIKDGGTPAKMEVFYLYPYAGDFFVGSFMYPLDTICVVGTNVLATAKLVGAADKIVCRCGGTVDATLYSDIIPKTAISDSVFNATFEQVTQFISENGMFDAIITLDSASYLQNQKQFEDIGINVIRIAAADGAESLAGALTIGFMLGLESESQKYVAFCDTIFDILRDRIDTIPQSERVTTMSVTMTNYVSGLPSDYYNATELAGGINLADWTETTRQFNPVSDGHTWMYDMEYQSDFIIHYRTLGYGTVDVN